MRSNLVETVCRRVNPDDWDGDGLANEIDGCPTECDGDCFGTSAAWYSEGCGSLLWGETNAIGETVLHWNDDDDAAAYYWLDLSVTDALGVATVRVTCDGQSSLGDMVVVARTNEVCHIPLLAGASYDGACCNNDTNRHVRVAKETALTNDVFKSVAVQIVRKYGGAEDVPFLQQCTNAVPLIGLSPCEILVSWSVVV